MTPLPGGFGYQGGCGVSPVQCTLTPWLLGPGASIARPFLRMFLSIARVATGAFGFLIFNHAFDGPDLYGASSFSMSLTNP
jgi:hypothetical protein